MMINSGKYLNYIIEKVSIIRYELMSKNKLNLNDDNVILENFVANLMNYVYGYNLSNLNREKSNYPGLDLGDKSKKIGVQVTSTPTSRKINDTLDKINKYRCYEQFNIIKIFILSEKQKTYSIENENSELGFDWQRDIIDFDDLYKDILYIPPEVRYKISEYIRNEIIEVLDSLGVNYYDSYDFKRCVKDINVEEWHKIESRSYEISINHCFGYLPFHVDVIENGENIVLGIKRDKQKVLLSSSSPLSCKVLIS